VQGTGHQDPAVPAAARVDQGPEVAAAEVPVAVPAEDPVVPEEDPVAQAPAVPAPAATNKNKLFHHSPSCSWSAP
jgi:hypothetical protein